MKRHRYEPLGIGAGSILNSRYEITKKLGSGGISAVYIALDKQSPDSPQRALKIFDPRFNSAVGDIDSFRNELMRDEFYELSGIVQHQEFSKAQDGKYYLVMELLDKGNLEQLLYHPDRNGLAFSQVVYVIQQVASALSQIHQQQIVHGNLHPRNILLNDDGIKLNDAATPLAESFKRTLLDNGELAFSPYGLAPELIEGAAASPQSDFYALGAIAYELCTRSLPFYADDWPTLAVNISETSMPKCSSMNVNAPSWFEAFLQKACAKKPEARYSSAEEIAELFSKHAEDSKSVQLVDIAKQEKEIAKKHRQQTLNAQLYRIAPILTIVGIVVIVFLLIAQRMMSAAEEEEKLRAKQKRPTRVVEEKAEYSISGEPTKKIETKEKETKEPQKPEPVETDSAID